MKRGIKTLALSMSLLVVASTLTSCNDDYTYPDNDWKDGIVVNVGGKNYTYKQIYNLMEEKKDSAVAYYKTAKNILAQLVTPVTDSIKADVDNKMTTYESGWTSSAKSNGTSYKEEKEKTLSSEGCIDEDALRDKVTAEAQVSANEKTFYAEYDGSDTAKGDRYYLSEDYTKAYVEKAAPYHVSHILIKVDAASGGAGTYSGQISSDDASQIGNLAKMLSSTSTFGSTAQALSDDTSSASQNGELATYGSDSTSKTAAMTTSTSYINEFKLGLYCYDSYLNKDTSTNSTLKSTVRLPSTNTEKPDVADTMAETEVAKKNAFGIPLSVALTIGYLSDTEKSDAGKTVAYTDANQYPRNVLFNNYFNQHSVSFVYNDADDYDATFLAEINSTSTTQYHTISDVRFRSFGKYDVRMKQYDYVKSQLSLIDSDKFTTASNLLADDVNLVTYSNNDKDSGYKTTVKTISSKNILTDEKGNPIIVVRGGTSDYQGIHFIVVNKDPFVGTDAYRYWRTNIPSTTNTKSAYTTDYNTDPSFINFVSDDPNKTSVYSNRSDAVKADIKAYDSNIDFKIFEKNLATYKSDTGKDFLSLLPEDVQTLINEYLDYTRSSSKTTANDTLDSSWKSYAEMLNVYEDIQTRGMIPTIAVSWFEDGAIPDEWEDVCHVSK